MWRETFPDKHEVGELREPAHLAGGVGHGHVHCAGRVALEAEMKTQPRALQHRAHLVAVEQGTLPTGQPAAVGPPELEEAARTGIPVLDEQARTAYRRRLTEIEADIEDATRCNDLGRLELAERDRDFLIAELSRAVGLGGRFRSVGSDVERGILFTQGPALCIGQ